MSSEFKGAKDACTFFTRIRVRDCDPLGRRLACAAPLQARRGGAAGAHGKALLYSLVTL